MIKAGQIYRTPITHYLMCVTYVEEDKTSYPFNVVHTVYTDGEFCQFFENDIEGMELMAEYPTWQEAVNSKEFKND